MLEFAYVNNYEHKLALKSTERITYGQDDIVLSKIYKDEKGKEEGELFVKSTSHSEVFRYGYRQIGDDIYHKDGYIWSSRVGLLNIEFNQDFVEVVIDSCGGYCMHLEDAKKYLPEEYHFEKKVMFKEEEIYYYVMKNEE